ncbi:hypothetical protein ACIA8O_03415 [Kitasatospora sp. NPDC051853]|uniref:hypothetical protein n=1 Tax=Kitasatospora sp. NPDC051853 TaxID=3364058 RepID=UPI00379110D0
MYRSTRFAGAGALGAAALALTLLAPTPAVAVAPPLSDPYVAAHFDFATGQLPENVALEPDGSADLTLLRSLQVARVSREGKVEILATLPAEEKPATPLFGYAALTGIVRADDGTLYVNYVTGTKLTGIWRIRPGGAPEQIAALPPDGIPNGLTLDQEHGMLYAADSVMGVVWRVPVEGGVPLAWAIHPDLRPNGFIGANGARFHDGAVWVSNTDCGTVLRIAVGSDPDASPGPVEIRHEGLDGIDDFNFTGHQDDLLAARNVAGELVHVTTGGTRTVVLTKQDGLSNPTSVAVCGEDVYVTSGAFFEQPPDPNLLRAAIHS